MNGLLVLYNCQLHQYFFCLDIIEMLKLEDTFKKQFYPYSNWYGNQGQCYAISIINLKLQSGFFITFAIHVLG